MKVWFVAYFQQDEYLDDSEPVSYDTMMDSSLFASEEAANFEAEKLYEEALQDEAARYERMVARYNARRRAYDILTEAGMENISDVFYFDEEESHPEFSEPKRRQVLSLDVVE